MYNMKQKKVSLGERIFLLEKQVTVLRSMYFALGLDIDKVFESQQQMIDTLNDFSKRFVGRVTEVKE